MLRVSPDSGPSKLLNQLVDGLIARGEYRRALALPDGFALRGSRDSESELLVQINLAEAEYNLGRWDDAWARLRGLDPLACAFPIARAGLAQQRAWIAAHQGDATEALHHWKRAELRDLPRNYHAEHFFTGAVALIGNQELDAALGCARAGEALAERISSQRNALFIRARVALAMGDLPLAESLCEAASEHRCRHAGGDGLFLWGELLERMNWQAKARRAYALAVERDGESESARLAAARLDLSARGM
jgi:hypothetical protein